MSMSRSFSRWQTLNLAALLLASQAGAGGAGAPNSAQPSSIAAPPSLTQPVRELQLAAAPDGSLILSLLSDSGEFFSGRGWFTGRELTAWRYGGAWQPLGGVLNYDVPRPASTLNMALDERGQPLLVWNENYGDNDVVVMRAYENGAWTNWHSRYLGDDLPYAARTRAVAMRDGEPVLAWGEYLRKPYGSRLTVRKWDGQTSWVRSEAFNDIKAFSRTPALATDSAGRAVVAWLQGEVLTSNVYVSRQTSSTWEKLGGSLNRHPQRYLASTRLVLDDKEQPIVAWLEDLGGQDTLYASRWNGQAWQALGGPVNQHFAAAPSLAVTAEGQPVLAWVEEKGSTGQIKLARWTGAGWQAYGIQNLDPKKDARSPAVTVLPDGKLALAWREDVDGIYTVQLREFGR
ncbi:hypothetical protein EHF33_06755 [Deinococcus psychrotolerans]|uniref:Uncharacterized protein n=1 Tax=Deinococcus psychrotolerans TaxID=2489213 RepID=A0A3G8YBV5_9DEIO|nr:hypothetical protein [Deinococcus psychrotolerans]AZI42485.1 hypothetical protein EHF33_06755 [Deinococcus psychrotolerans]